MDTAIFSYRNLNVMGKSKLLRFPSKDMVWLVPKTDLAVRPCMLRSSTHIRF